MLDIDRQLHASALQPSARNSSAAHTSDRRFGDLFTSVTLPSETGADVSREVGLQHSQIEKAHATDAKSDADWTFLFSMGLF